MFVSSKIVIGLLAKPYTAPVWMFKAYDVPGYDLRSFLGSGASCRAYECVARESQNKETFVCKIFHNTPDAHASYAREQESLRALREAETPNVPRILRDDLVTTDGELVLIVTPLGRPVPCSGSAAWVDISRKHLKQLVKTVRWAHQNAQLIHRDIKPENMIIDQNGNLILNDWGCSIKMDEVNTAIWSGSPRYACLKNNSREEDLILTIRTAFVLITQRLPQEDEWDTAMGKGEEDDEEDDDEEDDEEDTIWEELLHCANALNYDRIIQLFGKMMGSFVSRARK